jgi:hypothetical protein
MIANLIAVIVWERFVVKRLRRYIKSLFNVQEIPPSEGESVLVKEQSLPTKQRHSDRTSEVSQGSVF